MSFFCQNIFNFDHFSHSSSKRVSIAAALSPETVVSTLPKPTWGKGKGWQGTGSNMSAPGCRVNLVHQHLGLYSLIASRWGLSTELVFEAFKVDFSEFPWGQECRFLALWCCQPLYEIHRAFEKNYIYLLFWWGEKGMLICAGLPCACRMGTSILWFLSTCGHELRFLFSEDSPSSDKQRWNSGISQYSLLIHFGMQRVSQLSVWPWNFGPRVWVLHSRGSLNTFRRFDFRAYLCVSKPKKKDRAQIVQHFEWKFLLSSKVMMIPDGHPWSRAHHIGHRHRWPWTGPGLSLQLCRQQPCQPTGLCFLEHIPFAVRMYIRKIN